ncbi:MAG TPA: SIMPL domain-containing protein [Chitinophagaceae bacterium]|nr:SIMPL domain-containing protein [Chitinophagaceae bacterium]
MKQLLFLLLAIGSLQQLKAQYAPNPFPKTITVNGSAEMEVIPDEIYVQVYLKEYQKKGSTKVDIEKIKSDFLKNARSIGIPDSAISIASYEGYDNYPWWKKKKKDPEMFASIAYQVKLNSSNKLDQLVNVLDDEATENFQLIRTSHSKITEYRKQLKIQAVRAAKEKAGYLAEAINEKAGEAITINEPSDVSVYYYPAPNAYAKMRTSNVMMEQAAAPEQPGIDFRKIKLKFDVNVVFALK